MAHPVTTPTEWRRRAALADAAGAVDPPPPAGDLGRVAAEGLSAWDGGDDAALAELARQCRAFVWDQDHDRPGVRIGADEYVLAHAGPQRFDALGDATLLLARAFETLGDEDDLLAAVELHDLTAALGEAVWDSPANASVGRAAAALYEVTGEPAFLATCERVADMLCETQRPDGTWPGERWVTAAAARALAESADAVEARAPLEEPVDE
jgi:hypothetical protein